MGDTAPAPCPHTPVPEGAALPINDVENKIKREKETGFFSNEAADQKQLYLQGR